MLPIALLALVLSALHAAKAQDEFPSEVVFSVTFRDFLPAQCLDFSFVQGEWETSNGYTQGRDTRCDVIKGNTVWRNALNNGEISGHPDFELEGIFVDSVKCSANGLAATSGDGLVDFPVGSCVGRRANEPLVGLETIKAESGLPKPRYCIEDDQAAHCGVISTSTNTATRRFTQSRKRNFDQWYNDDKKFNRRVAQQITLTQSGTEGIYEFSNGAFFPLNALKTGSNAVTVSTAPDDAEVWPQSFTGSDSQNSFWFTTELHSTFEYRSDRQMEFTFSGDDDFWAYINNKLVIDLGGTHNSRDATIDLNTDFGGRFNVAEYLGLENGEVYTLDVFHAERQSTASNFAVTTSLFPTCNVLQSGTESFSFASTTENPLTQEFLESRFDVTDLTRLVPNSNDILLTSAGDEDVATYIYTRREENVARGFTTKFSVQVSDDAEGFAFVVQHQGLDNYPVSGGSNFNFRGLKNSFAVVFDLCADRTSGQCTEETVKVHYPNQPGDRNDATDATRHTHDNLFRSFINRPNNEFAEVEIIYYGGKPNFLEVFVDGSLYLREDNFDISSILGGLGGHVGLTATSTGPAADLIIRDWTLTTVEVDASRAAALFSDNPEVQEVVADGSSISEGFAFSTSDACGNALGTGTLQDLVKGFYVGFIDRNATESDTRRSLQNFEQVVVPATVIDNGDGTYNVALQTEEIATFSVGFTFGENCDVTVGQPTVEDNKLVANFIYTGQACFTSELRDATVSTPPGFVQTPAPTTALEEQEESNITVYIAAAGGGVLCLGAMATLVMVRFRQKWNREKKFVMEGNLYKMETKTKFEGGDEYTMTGSKLLKTQEEILRLQAQGASDPRTSEIAALERENQEMKTMIRVSKMRNTERTTALESAPRPKLGGKKGKVEL